MTSSELLLIASKIQAEFERLKADQETVPYAGLSVVVKNKQVMVQDPFDMAILPDPHKALAHLQELQPVRRPYLTSEYQMIWLVLNLAGAC